MFEALPSTLIEEPTQAMPTPTAALAAGAADSEQQIHEAPLLPTGVLDSSPAAAPGSELPLLPGTEPLLLRHDDGDAMEGRGDSFASTSSGEFSAAGFLMRPPLSNKSRPRRKRKRHAYNTHPAEKLTASLFLTVRGVENIFIYVWIAKDLAWTQAWYYASWIFGVLALVISFLALLRFVWMCVFVCYVF